MVAGIKIEKKNFISSRDASAFSGYAPDYIGQLCRIGKIECKRVGRVWYVENDSLIKHISENGSNKALTRSQILSQSSDIPNDPILGDLSEISPTLATGVFSQANKDNLLQKESVDGINLSSIYNSTDFSKKDTKSKNYKKNYTKKVIIETTNKIGNLISGSILKMPSHDFWHRALSMITAIVLVFGVYSFRDSNVVENVYSSFEKIAGVTFDLPNEFAKIFSGENVSLSETKKTKQENLASAIAIYTIDKGKSFALVSKYAVEEFKVNPMKFVFTGVKRFSLSTVGFAKDTSVFALNLFKESSENVLTNMESSLKNVASVAFNTASTVASSAQNLKKDPFIFAKNFAKDFNYEINDWLFGVYNRLGLFVYPRQSFLALEDFDDKKTTNNSPNKLAQYVTVEGPRTIVQNVTERVTYSGISKDEVEKMLSALNGSLRQEIYKLEGVTAGNTTYVNNVYSTVAQTNRIDQLQNVTITNPNIVGGNISGASFSGTTGSFSDDLSVSGGLSAGGTLVISATTGTSTFASDSSFDGGTLYIDSLNNRVGIATTTPRFTLDVDGVVNATAFYVNGSPYLGSQWTTAGSDIHFATGNIGVGTTTIADRLTVEGAIYLASTTPASTENRLYNQYGNLYWNGNLLTNSGAGSWTSSDGNVYRSTGNVGIGTSSPYAKLSVVGETVAEKFTATTTSTSTLPRLASSGISTDWFCLTGDCRTAWPTSSSGGGGVGWATSTINTESIYFTGLNNVGVGSSTPWARLSIAGSSLGTTPLFTISSSTASATSTAFIIDSNGKVGIGTTSPNHQLSVEGTTYIAGKASIGGVAINSSYGLTVQGGIYGVGNILSASNITTGSNNYLQTSIIKSWGYLNKIAFQNSAGTVTNFSLMDNGNLGVSTSTPWAVLSVSASSTNSFGTPLFLVSTSTASATSTAFIIDSNGKVGIGTTTPYTELSVQGGVAGQYFNADNASATSTLAGGLNVGSGSLNYDYYSGVTSITSLQTGSLNFDTDAGIVSWVDLPISASTIGTVQSYTANIGGTGILTVFGESNGSGGVQNTRVGIGSSTPYATLSVNGNTTLATSLAFAVGDAASTTKFVIQDAGNVGVGTTSPYAKLSVVGETVAEYFTATSTTATSTFAGGMNVAGTSGLTVLQNGNVGIGTAGPRQKLQIGSLTPLSTATPDSIDSGGTYSNTPATNLKWRLYNDGTNIYGIGMSASQMEYVVPLTTNRHVFYRGTTELMRITGTGNVGIGTTSPYAKLSINQSSTGQGFYLAGYANNTSPLFSISSSTASATSTAFIIDSNGKVGIGTTTPYAQLSVQGIGAFDSLNINSVATSTFMGGINLTSGCLSINGTCVGGGTGSSQWTTNGSNIYYSSGNVGIATTVPSTNLSVDGSAFLTGGLGVGTFNTTAGTLKVSGTGIIGNTLSVGSVSGSALTDSYLTYPTSFNRNDFTGTVGYTFKVTNQISVSKLGRLYLAGNTQDHIVKLWSSADQVTPLASGTILASSASDGNNVKWVDITPVTLNPGITYAMAINENSGGDYWRENWTSFTSIFTDTVGAYAMSQSVYPNIVGITVFGTPVMKYSITGASATLAVNSLTYGSSGYAMKVFDSLTNPIFSIRDDGKLSIGTTTPNNLLDLYSTTTSAIGFSGASGDTYKWTFGMDVSNGGRFSIASSTTLGTTDRFVIDGNGSVGIGTTSPSSQLAVQGGGYFTGGITAGSINLSSPLSLSSGGTGTTTQFSAGSIIFATTSGMLAQDVGLYWDNLKNRLVIGTPEASWLGTQVLAVATASSTIAGTSAGFWNLASSSSTGGGIMLLGSNDSAAMASGDRISALRFAGSADANNTIRATAELDVYASEDWSSTNSGSEMAFFTTVNGGNVRSERMRIANDGNVGVGTASPGARLSVLQSANTTAGGFSLIESGGTDYRSVYMNTSGVMSFYGGDTAGSLNTATLTAAGAWTNASDISYKENIVDLNSKYNLGTILSIKPRFYKMKGMDLNQIGFVAQELEKFVPEVVSGEDGTKGISYGNLTTLAVSAVQDISKILGIASTTEGKFSSIKLDDIESRLKTLENRNTGIVSILGLSADQILEFLKGLGVKITNGVAEFKKVMVEVFTIGSPSTPAGITMYDEDTGAPYCFKIKGGVATTTSGVCGEKPAIIPSEGVSNLDQGNQVATSTIGLPVITLLGNNPSMIEKGSSYVDVGATAVDGEGKSLMLDIISNTVNTSVVGEYEVVWSTHDSALNYATSTRKVIVFDPYVNASTTTPNQIVEPVLNPIVDIATSTATTTNP